jgi:hypothetical protein
VIEPVFNAAVRTKRVAPARARHPGPPLTPVAQIHGALGRPEHQCARHEILRRRARVERGIEWLLGDREIPGVRDEFGELGVGHRVTLHGERLDGRGVRGRLFRIELRRAHPK